MFRRTKKEKDPKDEGADAPPVDPLAKYQETPNTWWIAPQCRFFTGQQRISIEEGNRDVILCCNKDGLVVFHPGMSAKYCEHPYTVVRRFKCTAQTQTFALEEARIGQEPKVYEYYLADAVLMNQTFLEYIQKIVERQKELEKQKASQANPPPAATPVTPEAAKTEGSSGPSAGTTATPDATLVVPKSTTDRLRDEGHVRRERSNSLSNALASRPSVKELEDKNIMKTGGAQAGQIQQLAKRKRADSIRQLLESRPPKEAIAKGILSPVDEDIPAVLQDEPTVQATPAVTQAAPAVTSLQSGSSHIDSPSPPPMAGVKKGKPLNRKKSEFEEDSSSELEHWSDDDD